MAWNLAYDHVLRWILADSQRLAQFHKSIEPIIGVKRAAGMTIANREDFQEQLPKESEVIKKLAGHLARYAAPRMGTGWLRSWR